MDACCTGRRFVQLEWNHHCFSTVSFLTPTISTPLGDLRGVFFLLCVVFCCVYRFICRCTCIAGMLSLLSTTVLWGVKAQAKSMFATKRWILTSSYLAVMFISLFLAFKYGTEIHPGIYFTLICLQEFLYVSYCLSFVPYGRKIGWRVMTKAIDSCCGF